MIWKKITVEIPNDFDPEIISDVLMRVGANGTEMVDDENNSVKTKINSYFDPKDYDEKILNQAKIEEFVKNHKVKIMATSVAVFMIFNITISSMAALRQKERIEDIPADDGLDRFLDNMYPDEYMDEVFANKKYV